MSIILLAYEFGSGLGHLHRLLAVARGLARDHRLVFALPDLALGQPVLKRALGDNFVLRAGIRWPPPQGEAVRKVPTHSFADVLQLFGFGDQARLSAAAEEWRAFLDEVRPDLIVADFAPALRLAAGESVPTIVVGNGYTVPPAGQPMPPIRPWEASVPDASRRGEARLLEVVNAVARVLGAQPFPHLADLFSGTKTYVCTIPAFDPYAGTRSGPTTWPFNIPLIEAGPIASLRTGPAIFAYLPASHPTFDLVLEVLNQLQRPAHLYASEADPLATAARAGRHVGILRKPADFARALPQVQLMIHHAGLGTSYAGLAAGTPQIVLPLNLEHLITARGLTASGVAQGFGANTTLNAADLGAAVTRALDDPSAVDRARAVAARLAAHRSDAPLAAILEACRSLLQPV